MTPQNSTHATPGMVRSLAMTKRTPIDIRDDLLRIPQRERVARYADLIAPPGSWSDLYVMPSTYAHPRARAQQSRAEAGAGVAMGVRASETPAGQKTALASMLGFICHVSPDPQNAGVAR